MSPSTLTAIDGSRSCAPLAVVLIALGVACAVPAPEAEPPRTGQALTGRSDHRLPPGHWTVVARSAGWEVLAKHPAGGDVARPRPEQPEPTSLDVMILAPGELPRAATAALLPLELPGVGPEAARSLRVGRIRLGARDVYFTPPGWTPALLPSPAEPNLYVFAEANTLWALRRGQSVRRLTAERVGEFDHARLAARQREGEVILYWAADPVWSPDGRTIAYVTNREAVAEGGAGQSVWLLEVATGRERPLLQEHSESFRPVGWLGQELLFTGPPGVGAVDPRTGRRRQLAFGLELAVAADGDALAVGDNVPHATRIQVLSARGAQTVPAAPAGASYAAQAVFSPGGGRLLLLATAAEGRVRRYFIFERATGGLTPVTMPEGVPGDWPEWLDDNTLLATTIDATARAVSSWIVDVSNAPGT